MSWRTYWIALEHADGALNTLTSQGWNIVVIAPCMKGDEPCVFITAYLPPMNPRERFGLERKGVNLGIFQ